MSHDLEIRDGMVNAMFERVAWHRLGEVFGQNFGWDDLVNQGLPLVLPVTKEPLSNVILAYECPDDEYAAVRADGVILHAGHGAVWTPFQTKDGYDFGQAVRDQVGDGADLRSAGAIDQGRKWFMTFDLGEFSIGDYKVRDYVSVNGSFDGSWKLQLLTSPIVEVCANTIAAAKAAGVQHYSFKNTTNIKDRVEQAKRALAQHRQNRDKFATLGEALLATPVAGPTYGKLLEAIFPTDEDQPTRVVNANETAAEEVTKLYKASQPGTNFVSESGNAWAFVQAVNTWENWQQPVRLTKGRTNETEVRAIKQIDALVSGKQPYTDKAFELVGALN